MTRYIGKQPTFGNFVKLDAISVVNGQAAYTMQNGSSNFTNYDNVNQFIVSLNGVIQAPTDSFTVSGSTITFASNLVTGDSIDFILVLGDVLSVGTPSDNTISASKLQTDSVIEAKIQNDAVTKNKANFVSTGTGYTGTGLDIKGSGSANGRLGLLCSAGTHGVAIESPDHSAGQSYTIKLPDNQIAVDKFIKIKSISGSGNTAIGQAEFADAGGGFVKVGESTPSNVASVSLDGFFSSSYDIYRLYWYNLIPVTNNQLLYMRFNQSGSAVTQSNYKWLATGHYGATSSSATVDNDTHSGTGDNFIQTSNFGVGEENQGGGSNGYMDIFNPLSTDHWKWASGHTWDPLNDESYVAHYKVTARYDYNTSALSGVTLYFASGNIESGNVVLYGLTK